MLLARMKLVAINVNVNKASKEMELSVKVDSYEN